MNYQFPNRSVVIKLGGSIIHPEDINTPYIKEFKEFIEKNVEEKKKFVIVAGGGQLARKFQLASKEIKSELTQEEADWIGIHATRLNAQLLRTVLANITDPIVIHRRFKIKFRQYPVTISSGWTPGNSTDHIAAILAKDFKTKVFIVAGKPEYMYDKDPSKYKTAKPYKKLTWDEYIEMTPSEWTPGIHVPIDPVAARFAKKHKLTAIIIGGKDLKNLSNLIEGKDFSGTIID